MAGTRGRRKKAISTPSPARTTRSSKRSRTAKRQEEEEVPAVYQDLLLQDANSAHADETRPLKRPRTTKQPSPKPSSTPRTTSRVLSSAHVGPAIPTSPQADIATEEEPASEDDRVVQTIINETYESSESEESEFEWEDVVLGQEDGEGNADPEPEINDISITFGERTDEQKATNRVRRKGITSAERKLRLDIHKLHILCLLYHVHRRNIWCNDEKVQATVRKIAQVAPKSLKKLVQKPENSQFWNSKMFLEGVDELRRLWASRFLITAAGLHRARWADADDEAPPFSDFEEMDYLIDKADFRNAASTLNGSPDLGAQLFCAMLRGLGIETRLVCSLQCLPFVSSAQPPKPVPKSAQKEAIVLDPYNGAGSSSSSSTRHSISKRVPGRLSKLERALGERCEPADKPAPPEPTERFRTQFPVYWVEVFNAAAQKWVTIDPHCSRTTNKPEKLEPPLSNPYNCLAYVVAFEADSTVKDVTRRYAKAFNAKTRKLRVESTDGGVIWWKRTLSSFTRRIPLDRDQVEDAALARKEAGEGIPKNIQDFKGHPVYVLERHLRHNEVIHPKHQVGKVNLGTAFNPKMEPIYRRSDVHIVRSADNWYRLGRDVKDGEQPLKHAKPRKGARRSLSPAFENEAGGGGGGDEIGVGLYAMFQTELYVPPPVVRGRVPRNAYGNLDVYVPSMIPKGGVHIRHQHANKAARIVGVDYADAVTGFKFQGRHGTAVVQGIIVAEEYQEAVETVLEAMEYSQEQAENAHRTSEALRMWRRFFLGLRIAQRVNAYEIEGEKGNLRKEIDQADSAVVEEQMAGGFFPEGGPAEPSVLVSRGSYGKESAAEYGGGFVAEEAEGGEGGFLPDEPAAGGFVAEESMGGGFLPDDSAGGGSLLDDSAGGGFVHDSAGGFVLSKTVSFGSSILESQKLRHREYIGTRSAPADQSSSPEPMETEAYAEPSTSAAGGGFIPPEEAPKNAKSIVEDNAKGSTGELPIHPPNREPESEPIPHAPAAKPASPSPPRHCSPPTRTPKPETGKRPPSASPSRQHSDKESELSDAGSLPLEDPEDEDADPEWLLDMT